MGRVARSTLVAIGAAALTECGGHPLYGASCFADAACETVTEDAAAQDSSLAFPDVGLPDVAGEDVDASDALDASDAKDQTADGSDD